MTNSLIGSTGARRLRSLAEPMAGRLYGSGVVLAYHDILDDAALPYLYSVRSSVFRRQIAMVAGLGYEFVPLSRLAEDLLQGRSVSGKAAIVFDDALVGVHRHALPFLQQEQIPWTLLPVTDHLGAPPPWWDRAERTMDLKEIQEAVSAGAELCSHTASHVSLPDVDPARVHDELVRSRGLLSEWGGKEVVDLCYPFGHQNEAVKGMVKAAGYRTGWTFTNGRCRPGDDPFALRRMAMHDDLQGFRWTLSLLLPHWTWPEAGPTPRQGTEP